MQQYERIGKLEIDEVFHHIGHHLHQNRKERIQIGEFFVNVQSIRLRTFYHTGVQCPCCENKGSFFAIERCLGQQGGYHLNLYGLDKDKKEVLFTHDHKIARGLGGEDNLNNTITMCSICNWSKGLLEQIIANSFEPMERATAQEKLNVYLTCLK